MRTLLVLVEMVHLQTTATAAEMPEGSFLADSVPVDSLWEIQAQKTAPVWVDPQKEN